MSSGRSAIRVAVVGHVEWVQFARVPKIPRAGEIVNARGDFEEPAGGGAVAAVQLARIVGEALLITALGQDEQGRKSQARLEELGVWVCAAPRAAPTRRALTLLDARGERVITTFGERLQPSISDRQLPWEQLAQMDGVYFTAGDAGALRAARAARTLVGTPRAGDVLAGGVALDALVLSAGDPLECSAAAQLSQAAQLVVRTDAERGGTYTTAAGGSGSWRATPPPGSVIDTYGCGDCFAAGLTLGLAENGQPQRAIELAARCGAACATSDGPYEGQLRFQDGPG